jgi:hypothetical protein
MFKENTKYKIKTPSGYKPFSGIQKVTKNGKATIALANGNILICALNHRVCTLSGWKKAIELVENELIKCYDETFSNIQNIKIEKNIPSIFYDLVEVETNEYFTNNILSHNCEFIGSSNTLISPAKLKHIPYADAIRRTDDTRIYHEPEKGHLYVIVVDTARGTGNDYSAFVVFDISEVPYKVVATYRNNTIIPLLYPSVIFEAAKFYNEALLLPETNDIGGQIVDILHQDFEYDNILNTINAGRSGVQLSGGFSSGFIMGVRTTKSVKKLGCLQFKMLVENDKLIINDLDLLQEMYRFTQHGSSYEAEEGNDDLVMCCVLFSWLMGQHYMKNISDVDVRKVLLEENRKMIEDDVLPFGIIDSGIEDERYKIVDI